MDPAVISLIGIFVAVVVFILFIFKGVNVYLLSVLASILVGLFTGADIMKLMLGPFMTSFVGFAKSFFLLFAASAIFGRFVSDAGIAYSIGNKLAGAVKKSGKNRIFFAALCLPLINSLMTYSGLSLFVLVFTLMFIARDLFKELDVPWHFYGVGCFGSATFTLGMLPGSPQIQNLIPMKYFGTNPMAAPMLGIAMTVMMIILGIVYIKYVVNKAIKNGEHYMDTGKGMEAYLAASGVKQDQDRKVHPLWKCIIPLPIPIVVMNGFHQDPVIALGIAVIVTYALFRGEFKDVKKSLNEGMVSSFTPLLSVCAATGFGGVVASAPGFKLLVSNLISMPGPAELQLVVALALAGAIVGSASAGQTITLNALAPHYAPLIDAQVAHRLAAAASFGSFVPHAGAICSTVSIIKVSHKDVYRHYFWLGAVIPGFVTLCAILLAQWGLK